MEATNGASATAAVAAHANKRTVNSTYAAVACDECFAQKRKCQWNHGDAACRRCLHLKRPCKFERPAKNKLAKRKELQRKMGTTSVAAGKKAPKTRTTAPAPSAIAPPPPPPPAPPTTTTLEEFSEEEEEEEEGEEEEEEEEEDYGGAEYGFVTYEAYDDGDNQEHHLDFGAGQVDVDHDNLYVAAEESAALLEEMFVAADHHHHHEQAADDAWTARPRIDIRTAASSSVSSLESLTHSSEFELNSAHPSNLPSRQTSESVEGADFGFSAPSVGAGAEGTGPSLSLIHTPLTSTSTPLPDLTLLLNVYFENISPHFEFIHRQSFFDSLSTQPQYLLDSMCALAVPFLPTTHGLEQLPKTLFQRASLNLMSIEPLPRALPAVWTFLNLALHAMLHESSTQRALALAHGFHAMASSTAHSLRQAAEMRGRHPPSRDWVESEQRRRTWYSYWLIGTILEAASGQRQQSTVVDQFMPVPCSDAVWRRSRQKRSMEEPEDDQEFETSDYDPGLFVDLGLLAEHEVIEQSNNNNKESERLASVTSPAGSSSSSSDKIETLKVYSKPFSGLSQEDLPGSLDKYFSDQPLTFLPLHPLPTPPHNAFVAIVEVHGLLEHAMYVAKGEKKRGMGKEEVERALLKWQEMWELRKPEIGAKVWFGGMIVLRTALGVVNGIPSAGFRRESLRIAELLARLTDQQLVYIGPPYICLSIHSAGLALIELLDQPAEPTEREAPLSPQKGIEVCLNALKLHAGMWPLARVLYTSLQDAVRRWTSDQSEEFLWTGLMSLDLGEEGAISDEEHHQRKASKIGGGGGGGGASGFKTRKRRTTGGWIWGNMQIKEEPI